MEGYIIVPTRPLALGLQAEHLLGLPCPQQTRHAIANAMVRGEDHEVVGAMALIPEREVGLHELDGLLDSGVDIRATHAVRRALLLECEVTPQPAGLQRSAAS